MALSETAGPILIVEDDRKTASLVAIYLEREGFRTLTARDGQEALDVARRERPIFVILDLMLPRLDGWEVCRHLRRSTDVPILMLTARGEEVDRVSGLTLGADDYMVKPFSPRELVARVKAILRRARPRSTEGQGPWSCGGLVLDDHKRKVTLDGRPVQLTSVIANLLENACQYTPGGGMLRISSELGPGRIRVAFANTGAEIDEKDLPFIFERFYRGEKSRSRDHGGAGIGLAIVKELIEAHGGEVGAEISSGETRIWFSLPM